MSLMHPSRSRVAANSDPGAVAGETNRARRRRHHPFFAPVAVFIAGTLTFPTFTVLYGNQIQARDAAQARKEIVLQQHDTWCSMLDLLTSKPVPKPKDPKANPSRQQNYEYYIVFSAAKARLRC